MNQHINIKQKTNYELLLMVNDRFRYNEELLSDILRELDSRGVTNDRVSDLKKELSTYQPLIATPDQEADAQADTAIVKLYSESSIFMYSFIFSAFFASVIMALNLNWANKKKAILPLVSFGFLYSATVASISKYLGDFGFFIAIVLNGLGALIILRHFWKPQIGGIKYQKRSTYIPILIGFLLSLPALYFLSQKGMTI